MNNKRLVIVGGGPAGLAAALSAAAHGIESVIIDRNSVPGGQLIKQTHKFFGSELQYAKIRGINIAKEMIEETKKYPDLINIVTDATVLGVYPDYVVTYACEEKYYKIKAEAVIVATGAYEKTLAFENNDLPGIYGAGAVQTLANVYGIKPGREVLMVGSGNIGLIVSYQLLQAGVRVKAIIEAAPYIGGYKVHAAKLRRLNVPIMTSRTVRRAYGDVSLEGVTTVALDDKWREIPGTDMDFAVDALCLAVGLSPLVNLLGMLGADMRYIPELGGLVPLLDESYMTSIPNVFASGDAGGIEEASSAIVEGHLAGLYAARALGAHVPDGLTEDYRRQLALLRMGPTGAKIRAGLARRGRYA